LARDRTTSLANTTILLIRHAERPDFGTGLSPAGQARAEAYVGYFRNFKPRGEGGGDPFRFDHLFAAADSAESERPSLTLAPLVAATGLAVDTDFKDKEFEALARHLRDHPRFADSNILICWHHEKILGLAGALGSTRRPCPPRRRGPAAGPATSSAGSSRSATTPTARLPPTGRAASTNVWPKTTSGTRLAQGLPSSIIMKFYTMSFK